MEYLIVKFNRFRVTKQIVIGNYFILSILSVLLLIFTVLLNAWIGDDSQIMFRQIWNLLSGDGITFNFEQRIQAFSNTTWFWLVTIFAFFTKELYLTVIFLSVTLTISATVLLIFTENFRDQHNLLLISPIIFLPFSWAFIDYSTSGLENSLSYFLVSLFLYFLVKEKFQNQQQILFTILALLILNRLDYAILFLPITLNIIWFSDNKQQLLRDMLPGTLLIITWLVFATFYFGSPLPNTFYAKLSTGYPTEEVFLRGWYYLASMKNDLVSLLIIFLGITLSIISRNKLLISLAIGQFLYILFIFQAGGDFMLGRFFAILVFLSIGQIILSLKHLRKWDNVVKNLVILSTLLLIVFIGYFQRYPFLLAIDNYESRKPFYGIEFIDSHIVDEKMIYYFNNGLFSPTRTTWPVIQTLPKKLPTEYYATCGGLGFKSILNPTLYYIDECALTDSLISRIPAIHSDVWRIGHHYRKIPTEYGEFLIGNINKIPDSQVTPLLSDITLLTSGSLTDMNRLSAIWRVNTGYHSKIDFSNYINKNIWVPKTNRTKETIVDNWNNTPRKIIFSGVMSIQSIKPKLASSISFFVNIGTEYEVYINDKYAETIFQEHRSIATVINFSEPRLVNSIRLKAIKSDYRDLPEIFISEISLMR